MPEIVIIAAVAKNRVIGKDNTLIWNIPEDMAHFKALTSGQTVIMGRKTWESLPEKFRPLPGRLNVVVSRNADYDAPGAVLAASLEEAMAKAENAEEIFVIGGAELYNQALPLANRLYLTELANDFAGDSWFPAILPGDWQEVSRSQPVEEAGLSYAFVVYQRTQST